MAAKSLFVQGEDVYVFYCMDKSCFPQRKYVASLDARQGAFRPRMGLSEGWVPARVVWDHDPSDEHGQVCVEHRWPHLYTKRGHVAGSSTWNEWYPLPALRRAPSLTTEKGRLNQACELVMPGHTPELSIIAFRWGGRNEVHASAQWGHTGSTASDHFLRSFLDSAVAPALEGNYEVWSVYIEGTTDLTTLANAAHLIWGPGHPSRRAKHTVAFYLLYPTAFEENCQPNFETGSDNGAALVDQRSLFHLMQAVERIGLPTRFPHSSGLYEQLASKRWTYQLALAPNLRVPPTVALPRMLIEQSCAKAAKLGMGALEAIRSQQAALRGDEPPLEPLMRGVAKLGFSWEALDVKYWEGTDGLQESIYALTQAIEISEEMTGQPHTCEALILQEFVPHDLELRVYVVEGRIEVILYTKFCKIKGNKEFGEFRQLNDEAEAARQWMGGDIAALKDGERQCRALTEHWLRWVQAQCSELPAAIRFDYFASRVGDQAIGKAVVWTLEICELGFSMLGEKQLPDKVFAAMLRSSLQVANDSDSDLRGETTAPCTSARKRQRC